MTSSLPSFPMPSTRPSTRARTTGIGGVHPDSAVLSHPDSSGQRHTYWTDPWHAAQTRMLIACRAYGLRPIDGPYGDFSDPEGFLSAARRAAVLGFEGKWVIHPSQIEPGNAVYTPTEAEVLQARRIIDAMRQARQQGLGAVSLDGRLIDTVNILMAENLLAKAEAIAAR